MTVTPWESIAYEALEPRLRTGDVFLFHGASLRSKVIEDATLSEFSHVGMIVRPDPGKSPLLWHTDPRPITEDLDDGQRHGGAQLNDLSEAMAIMTDPRFGDTPFARQLVVERSPGFEDAALQSIAAMDGTAFPSLLKIVQEWVLGHLHVATSGRHMYCAEVLATTYQHMGLLPAEPPPNAYAPNDFSLQHEKLRLLCGASLGPQIQVQWNSPGASVR
jgi:hypothetical protein